jgi:hypothetical protein
MPSHGKMLSAVPLGMTPIVSALDTMKPEWAPLVFKALAVFSPHLLCLLAVHPPTIDYEMLTLAVIVRAVYPLVVRSGSRWLLHGWHSLSVSSVCLSDIRTIG